MTNPWMPTGEITNAGAADYTGYGTNPNFIYSSGGNAPMMGGFGLLGVDAAMNPLRSSLAYRQAGMEGKRRMEKVVSMGLPFNTDINKIQKVGVNPSGSPIYAAPRPQPWGTWGPLGTTQGPSIGPEYSGSTTERRRLVREAAKRASRKKTTLKPEEAKEGFVKNRAGYLEKDYSEEGYEKDEYGYWVKKT